jgi:hypothetical protein
MTGKLLALAALACGVAAAPAAAAFGPPVDLATGPLTMGVVADTDAAGATTIVASGPAGGPLLIQRTRDGVWQPATTLPGTPRSVVGPVVDAAGDGALGIAWRVDTPRKYSGIAVAVRDPGGMLSDPIAIAGPQDNGVRHPALAVDGGGDALLAYNTGTRAGHLNMHGAIAIAYRRGHGSFSRPVVVDREQSGAPAVALAADGTGIVAWVRPSSHIRAVSVDADGTVGKVKAFEAQGLVDRVVAAAGDGGAATVAWMNRHFTRTGATFRLRALRRAAGRAFGRPAVVASPAQDMRDLAIAADDGGRTTLLWSGGAGSPSFAATAEPLHAFGAAINIAPPSVARRTRPSLAAANGRVAIAWGEAAPDLKHVSLQVMFNRGIVWRPPRTAATKTLAHPIPAVPAIRATIAGDGTATVLYVDPVEPPSGQAPFGGRLVAVEGR